MRKDYFETQYSDLNVYLSHTHIHILPNNCQSHFLYYRMPPEKHLKINDHVIFFPALDAFRAIQKFFFVFDESRDAGVILFFMSPSLTIFLMTTQNQDTLSLFKWKGKSRGKLILKSRLDRVRKSLDGPGEEFFTQTMDI